jgi:hypothetical protein
VSGARATNSAADLRTRLISLICLIRAMGHAECVLRYF